MIALRRLAMFTVVAVAAIPFNREAAAEKLDYLKHHVGVEDPDWPGDGFHGYAADLTDGYGGEPYPVAVGGWVRADGAPANGKPAAVIFDYGTPQRVTALAHYFYVPGCRDHRWGDWLSGPSAFHEVKIYTSDNKADWKEVAHLTDLPPACPQVLKVTEPASARYLKLEVIALAPGAGLLRSYEIETYLNEVPISPIAGDFGKAVRSGFPNIAALQRAADAKSGGIELGEDGKRVKFQLLVEGLAQPLSGSLEIHVNHQTVAWSKITANSSSDLIVAGDALGSGLEMNLRRVKAGLLVGFTWHGPAAYPSPKIDILAGMEGAVSEWCIPEYYHSRKAPEGIVSVIAPRVPTRVSMICDGRQCLSIVPDTDQSWVGLAGERIFATFPLRDTPRVLLMAGSGNWFSGFRRVVSEVFDFDEPRQFSPVSQALFDQCKSLLVPDQWSDKYDTFRAFPDLDSFSLFYGMPYEVPALSYWERITGDTSIVRKVDRIVQFALDRRLRTGPMRGAMFTGYTDCDQIDHLHQFLSGGDLHALHLKFPQEQLIGHDQGNHRWLTSHNMGAVLWSITHVWRSRGHLEKDVLAGATDVADWLVRCQQEDGSWPYAFNEDGSVAFQMSDSGTIWNVWALYRFGRLTKDPKYSAAAERAEAYYKNTFINQHLYRGYWEDMVPEGSHELGTVQGYEASIAALAFAEMGDVETMKIAAQDCLRFVCTRTLESRTYETSYGGVSEQRDWAPGTYIASTLGYAAHVAWRQTGDDVFRRFSGLAKGMGWWQYKTGSAFWLEAAIVQQPIEMYRERGRARSFWVFWDSAQKVTFGIPWLVDEVNRRSGDRIKIDVDSLAGKDDRGVAVAVCTFDGRITSVSGQVNWLGLKSTSSDKNQEYQLALINHAEATIVTVESGFKAEPTSIRMYDENGRPAKDPECLAADGTVKFRIPEKCMALVVW